MRFYFLIILSISFFIISNKSYCKIKQKEKFKYSDISKIYPLFTPQIDSLKNKILIKERFTIVSKILDTLEINSQNQLLVDFALSELNNHKFKNVNKSIILKKIGTAYYNINNLNLSSEFYNKALNFIRNKDIELKYELYLYLSEIEAYNRNIDFALKYCDSITLKKFKDDKLNAEMLNHKSILYSESNNFQVADKFIDSAIIINKRIKDSITLAVNYTNKARIYYIQKQYKTSHKYYKQSFNILIGKTDSYPMINAINLANSYISVRKFIQAEKLYKEILIKLKEHNNNRLKSNTYYCLSDLYNLTGKLPKAITNIDSAIFYAKKDKDYYLLKDAFRLKSVYLSNLSKYKQANKSLNNYILYRDSLEIQEKNIARKKENLKKSVPFTKINNKSEEVNNVSLHNVIILILVFVSVFIILLYKILKKNKLQLLNIKFVNERDSIINNLKEKLNSKENIQNGLELEIKHSKDEINKLLSVYNESNSIIKKCFTIIKSLTTKNNDDKSVLLAEFQRLSALYRSNYLTDVNNHDAYIDLANDVKMKFPDLTKKEEQLCIFLKLNYSLKEISHFMNISPKSVDTSRYRLRKKLGFNTNEEFLNHLNS